MPESPRCLLHVTTVPAALRAFMAPTVPFARAAGWHVDAAAAGADGADDLADAYGMRWDIPWSRNPAAPSNLAHALPEFRAVLARERYDLVHVMTPVAAFVTRAAVALLPRRSRPAVVYAAHGFHFYAGGAAVRNALYKGLERLAAPWTDALCVLNEEDEQAAYALGLADPERTVRFNGPGIDLSRFCPDAVSPADVARVRAGMGIGPGETLVVQVAEFIPRKRHADLIRALARLPHVHLALPGDGPQREAIQKLAADLGIEDRVHLLGFRRDVPAIMRASNAVVLVSEQEGLPTCVIEALALGVPVVGTDIRGTRDLLARGGGWLVPLGDIEAITGALRGVARGDRPPPAPDMSAYSVEAVSAQYERAYQIALASRSVR